MSSLKSSIHERIISFDFDVQYFRSDRIDTFGRTMTPCIHKFTCDSDDCIRLWVPLVLTDILTVLVVRVVECDQLTSSIECDTWSHECIEDYLRHMKRLESKGPHTSIDNRQSLESQVGLCMHGVIVLPKVVDFDFGRIGSTSKLKLMIVACMGALSQGLKKKKEEGG